MDIRLTDPYAYVCAIHWQVAQATSLENIEFYMLYNSEVAGNTQQVSEQILPSRAAAEGKEELTDSFYSA